MQRFEAVDCRAVERLLTRYGLQLQRVPHAESIPASYWGDSEAGLLGKALYVRPDTPLHSLLHEASHYICMSAARRAGLDRDAGGDDAEECAVCYLQILLSDLLAPVSDRARAFADMDAWGYSFRLGTTRAWFERDAGEARDWLRLRGITDAADVPTGRLRC